MTALDLGSWIRRIGRRAVAEIVREIQATDPARPLGKISKRSALAPAPERVRTTWSTGLLTG